MGLLLHNKYKVSKKYILFSSHLQKMYASRNFFFRNNFKINKPLVTKYKYLSD